MNSIPRNEHPNPQFYRDTWRTLNGEWELLRDVVCEACPPPQVVFNEKIIVPFCLESVLSGIGYTGFVTDVNYRRSFELARNELSGNVLLHIGACDYFARVYVNGILVAKHKGGYSSFTVNITAAAKEGSNTVTVCVHDDVKSPLQASGKQSEREESYGCFYTRTTGIWQSVWLEFVPKDYVESVRLVPNVDAGAVEITAQTTGSSEVECEAFLHGVSVGKCCTENGAAVLKLSTVELWSVGNGVVYDLEMHCGDDTVKSYFGMRKVELVDDKFLLNGKSVFQRLVLDQGFYPDGIYTAPTAEALRRDIELSLNAGFNGARLHQKVFEPLFLYYCDIMGYLVWGEYGSWGLDHTRADAADAMLPEWLEILERDFNHPSIIGWCPFNETWDIAGVRQDDSVIRKAYEATKAFDCTRPCIDTSGNFHVVTDIYDVHDYCGDTEKFRSHYAKLVSEGTVVETQSERQTYNGEPFMVSEYGGIGLKLQKSDDKTAWSYGDATEDLEAFYARYRGLTQALLDNPRILGFCYTQLTDVEQEQNGIYAYSREKKMDISVIREINSRKAEIEK